jgi:NADPH:quinone reductase-like Zn-dependent oxidoreductase
VAGTVVAVGNAVTAFAPGADVFGGAIGGFAEYARAAERTVVPKPSTVSFAAAAAVPVAGVTALQGLRNHGRIAVGQRVAINGASGGVGTLAVQLAKAFGTHVTGVCSTRNVALLRSVGADDVVDYTRRDFTVARRQYDLILDTVGNHSLEAYERCLKPGGTCVLVGRSEALTAQMEGYEPAAGAPTIATMLARLTRDDLLTLADLLASGTVAPVIDRTYRLDQTADAMAYLGTRRARGKVIITVVETSR